MKTWYDQTGLFLWQCALRHSHTSVGSFLCAPVLEGCTVLEILVSKHWSLQPFEWQDLGFPFHLWLEQAHPSLLLLLSQKLGELWPQVRISPDLRHSSLLRKLLGCCQTLWLCFHREKAFLLVKINNVYLVLKFHCISTSLMYFTYYLWITVKWWCSFQSLMYQIYLISLHLFSYLHGGGTLVPPRRPEDSL